jgi:hypothetical protein
MGDYYRSRLLNALDLVDRLFPTTGENAGGTEDATIGAA